MKEDYSKEAKNNLSYKINLFIKLSLKQKRNIYKHIWIKIHMNYKTYHVFFSKLSNPLRIKIISNLDKKGMSVTELVEKLKVEQSKLSHALKELRKCNIVQVKKEGKKRIYNLDKSIYPILRLIDCHSKICSKCKGCK